MDLKLRGKRALVNRRHDLLLGAAPATGAEMNPVCQTRTLRAIGPISGALP
jgi:hypothetical protein